MDRNGMDLQEEIVIRLDELNEKFHAHLPKAENLFPSRGYKKIIRLVRNPFSKDLPVFENRDRGRRVENWRSP